MVETIIGVVVLMFIVVASVLYCMDRKGWNATVLRASKIVRSHLPSNTGKINHQLEKADWEAQFTGTPLVTEKHKLIETWTVNHSGIGEKLHAKCLCGYSETGWVNHVYPRSHDEQQVKDALEGHVRASNKAEKNKALTDGKFEF